MDQNIVKPKIKRRSREQIILLLDEFAKAGICVEEFCARHYIGKSTFHKWQSRYNKKQNQTDCQAFADIEIVNAGIQHSATLFAEVKGIKIYQAVSAAYLKELSL